MEHRKTRRFQLQLPVSITRSGSERISLSGQTQNISSNGVLFTAGREPDLGGPIEYVIALTHAGAQSVSLRCIGKVVRAEPVVGGESLTSPDFQIAATLERYEFIRATSATA